MERRLAKRYDAKLLQKDLAKVMLIFQNKYEVESSVVDISTQGLRLSIPPSTGLLTIPQDIKTVEVHAGELA